MSTAPWQSRAIEDTLDAALSCIVELYAVHPTLGVVELEVVTAQFSYDERRVPYVHLRGAIVATPAALAAIDETAEVRIRVDAGYEYAGRVRDVHTVAQLLVDTATVQRPAGQIVFDAYSDELLMARVPWAAPAPWTSSTTFADAYRSLIAAVAGGTAANAAVIAPTIATSTFIAPGEQLVVRYDDDLKTLMRDIADRVGAHAYHDGLTGWRADLDTVDPDPVAAITHGTRGLLRSSEQLRNRTAWGNAQIVVHRWTDTAGTAREVIGRAEQTTGPYAVAVIGRKTLPVIVRTHATTQAAADRAAQSVLSRVITRRRVIATEAARALWWVRPRDTITVATPDDDPQPLIVTAVTFDLPAATMQTQTRTPEA